MSDNYPCSVCSEECHDDCIFCEALGLSGEYTEKGPCHEFIRQVLALPLLPAEHIRPAFSKLTSRSTAQLMPLMGYVDTTWISGPWKVEEWSVFGQSIRTNNDCEGWHRRLNYRCVGPPPFYLLVRSLHEEARLLPIQVKLITERKLSKDQRKKSRSIQALEDTSGLRHIDPKTKEVKYNPKFCELYAPQVGPANPYKTKQFSATRNTLAGYVEEAHVSDFQFENQRRTFTSYGYAVDPTADTATTAQPAVLGDTEKCDETKGLTVFEATKKRPEDKRKRLLNDDPSSIEDFIGPWGKFVDEKTVMKPNEEEKKELDVILAKRAKASKQTEEKPMEEKTTLHLKEPYDYQGRSWLHVPQDVGVNLKSEFPPEKCFIPKKLIHTWTGHTKGLAAIRWFPKTAHLLLSCSMDCKIKIWEVYNERRCVRTYTGHKQAVRDITFNNSGSEFLSCGYDRYCKLWDTETGECKGRFTSRKVPYCVKYHPEDEKQHLFVAGTSDKKIVCWDTRSGEIVQEYDRHLGAVNSITFVDQNRRFVSSSDDKSLRVWEWDVPVDFKYIADPSMHSMPSVTLSPNGKWLACQSMDNKISVFNVLNRFKYMRKKTFTGHMVAGYACSCDFSPEMSYVISGDADGKLYIWDWKSTKLYSKFKAHDDVCISAIWHPHETSKVATAGWDGVIKFWD